MPTSPRSGSLSVVIRTYKAAVTHEARLKNIGDTVWQRGFYEHVIRTEKDLREIRSYAVGNPLRWALDEENPSRHRQALKASR